MDNIRKSNVLIFLCVLLFFANGYAQDTKQIKLKSDLIEFKVIPDAKNKDILTISTSISLLNVKGVSTKGGNFINLESVGLVKIFGKGKPNLPVFSRLIEVPLDAKVEANVLAFDEEIVELQDHDIYEKIIPAQPSLGKHEDPEKVPFYYDRLAYDKDEFLDTEITSFEDLGIMRNVRLVRVQVKPIQYNPVQNKLKILNNMKIEIKFKDADHSKTKQLKDRSSSALFDRMLERTVANFELEVKPLIEEAITYVIVSDRMFETTLQPLILWKETLGYNVIVGYTDEPNVGNTTTSIKNYLEDLYNNPPSGMQPPHYLLLVGDVDQIPPFDGTTANHVTDLYYCEYTGDVMPDVFYGRFSANTVAQLQPQIDKTLQYEQYTMPDPSYILEAVLVAGADAYNNAMTYGNGQINYGTDIYFNSANGITPHAYLQPEPAGGNYSVNIRADISNGAGFANYTAHCDPTGWSDPSFSTADIPGLTNLDKYGLWVANCCRSNRFSEAECFGEAALRAQNRGALGYIGGTNYTYWDEDYWWTVGFKTLSTHPVYDANQLGADDRLFHTHGEITSEWYSTQGQLIVGGNLAVQGSTSGRKTYFWEIYQLMGDPSVEIRTKLPEALDVVHPTSAPTSNNNFIVAVKKGFSMIPDATVSLIKDNQVIDSKITADSYPDKGTAKFSYNLTPGPMTIYVTKSNYIPYMGTCELQRGISELWVSLHSGATYPYNEWYEDTFCFNAIVNIEYHFRLRWAAVFEVAYNDFRWREQDQRFHWWNFSGTMRYYFPIGNVRIFVNAGPGLYLPDEGDTRLGVKAGLGINFPLSDRLMFEAGSDYHAIFAGNKEILNQNKSTSFQHFHVGVVFKLK